MLPDKKCLPAYTRILQRYQTKHLVLTGKKTTHHNSLVFHRKTGVYASRLKGAPIEQDIAFRRSIRTPLTEDEFSINRK